MPASQYNLFVEKIYFILGCTACGKGAVGREIARRLGGAVLSVDSMKVYRRMDIGTAKPGVEARAAVPHYGIDVVEPSEAYSVAQYVEYAEAAIKTIRADGCVPLAVGGTSLYIKAMTEGLFEGPSADSDLRAEFTRRIEANGLAALHAELVEVDPAAAERIHPNDEKRIVRALEVFRKTGNTISSLQTQWAVEANAGPFVRIGLRRDRDEQNRRINARVKKMVDMGLRDEVAALLAEPDGLSKQAAQAVGYAEVIEYLRGDCPFEKAVERVKINTRRLAKKQRTWQRRWTDVIWFDLAADDTVEAVADRIMKEITFE
ncbi:MAG: tRNA (adenosine(37)-N6)-dimethylallyltransferase MiaA [Phycisphaerae bacterium]|nr:tRNA (adenosine(37)-N6)-dimethylallyltransferase MiaA [Phycisphaerae bacterium]